MSDNKGNIFDTWRSDWNAFIRDAFDVRLDREQQAIIDAVQHERRVSVRSGTARGKDFLSACAAMCFLYLTPRWDETRKLCENTKVALTAPTDRQVKNIMMPEISRLFTRAAQRGYQLPGRLTAYDIRTSSEEWFLTGFKADEYNHEAWSGFHAVHTMFVVTEATGISDDTFAAIEGNLQGDSRILIVFNPNTTAGYAAQSQRSDRWKKFALSSLSAPNVIEKRNVIPGQVDYEWVADKVRTWAKPILAAEASESENDFEFEGQWYRPTDLFRKKVLGEFPKVSEDVLVPPLWIELAQRRWESAAMPTDENDIILGVDVAGMGRDCSVIVKRKGARVTAIESRNSGGVAEHMRLAGEIASITEFRTNAVASVDTIGEGAGVFSRLAETMSETDNLISCKFSAAAKDKYGKPLSDVSGQYRFANMRAYCLWAVRDWLNPDNGFDAQLPPSASDIIAEAMETRWSFRSDGSVAIEAKEDIKRRLGRSPDILDALANTFHPDAVARMAELTERRGNDTETEEYYDSILY